MSASAPGPRAPGTACTRAYVALGANLGDARAMLESALEALGEVPGIRLVAQSSLYVTAPIGVTGQPDFINAVAAIDTTLSPRALLGALLDVEARHGRIRHYPLAARTLDLDLLLYGDETVDLPGLEVPHPRMHLRAFVLVPLAEIAPAVAIPGRGQVADLLSDVRDQAIEPLPLRA